MMWAQLCAIRSHSRIVSCEFISDVQARSLEQAVSCAADIRACPTPHAAKPYASESSEHPE